MKNKKIVWLIIVTVIISISTSWAQGSMISIGGEVAPVINTTETYYLSLAPNLTIIQGNWESPQGGQTISQTATSIKIKWTSPNGYVSYRATQTQVGSTNTGPMFASLLVYPVPPPAIPLAPTIGNFCDRNILTYATPPEDVEYFWHTDATDPNIGQDSNKTITLTTGNTIYLSARGIDSGLWSEVRTVNYAKASPTTWYSDADNDGLRDPTGTSVQECNKPLGNWTQSNIIDQCPNEPGSEQQNGCPTTGEVSEGFNTITSRGYDINGTLKAASKSYYNTLGKVIQSQALDIKTNRIWASDIKYDLQNRATLQTLSAPIREFNMFEYEGDFVKKIDNSNYTKTDYDNANNETPNPIGNTYGTLGWYYSSGNIDEDYQDITDYPFAKSIYSTLIPGKVLRTVGGEKINGEWKQTYTFSMRASNELSQTEAFGDSKYNHDNYKIIKTVHRDVHGNENVVFTDTDGKTLATARSGGTNTRSMSIEIGDRRYVDIHVPAGNNMGFTTSPGGSYAVYDLITENKVTPSESLPNGFYRVFGSGVVNYKENYYDYALNEYDLIGRLIASYQPLNKLKTEYKYNTLGQLTYTKSPDEGEAWFKYRRDGQIRFSQNSKQLANTEFSYTNYDGLGRPIESGVFNEGAITFTNADSIIENIDNPATTADEDGLPDTNCSEQQFTTYDALNNADLTTLGAIHNSYSTPTFLAGNVAKTSNGNTTTYYSYDVYGRVKWIVQEIPILGTKTIDYKYDPITGAVLEVDYQRYATTSNDRFIHRYNYDPIDNSLIKVETSADGGNTYTTNAEYKYYETGALKRTEIAPLNGTALQGIDYVYNLNGQLKSINHPSLEQSKDPGGDSNDLFGMMVDYHSTDYNRTQRSNIETTTFGQDQYNGNIKGIRWNSSYQKLSGGKERVYDYRYNKNNWLTDAYYGKYSTPQSTNAKENETYAEIVSSGATLNLEATNSITLLPGFHAQNGSVVTTKIIDVGGFLGTNGDYDVTGITYDANGNIQALKRNKNTVGNNNSMDNLSYNYYSGKPNQLKRVDDAAGDVSGAEDIGDQVGDSSGENYKYNSIGQLEENVDEKIKYFYNASGLVTEIHKNNVPLVKFFYNDKGHRVKKEIYTAGSLTRTDYYVRDATGTTLAIYEGANVKEYTIYGASRLGVYNKADDSSVYQLTDHLGNVRAVVQRSGNDAVAMVATDYYPFGMPMPNRNVEGNYRYKYQGQEKDPETGKEAFELRLWDSRIGRWLTTDPYGQFYSPYLGMGNNPISFRDPDGGFVCDDCPEGIFADGTEHISADGGTYVYDAEIGRWSDGAAITFNVKYTGEKKHYQELGAALLMRGAVINSTAAAVDGHLPFMDAAALISEGLVLTTYGYFAIQTFTHSDYEVSTTTKDTELPSILLYRGVHAKHPGYASALMGVATPFALGPVGHNDPALHNSEDIGNNHSIFTSWTTLKQIANYHATKHGPGGLILTKRFRINQLVPSPDIFDEGEWLVPGVVTGASVSLPSR
ncbi:RHS repeat domain-containing protein [Flavivirga eckloniae]|uniref:RHS repeat-associated core domain-containing protein n=1 Tax=Flavivirga eckloniae TaxID=1803846 RepID=A0A2K9PRL6_9FLAO|nr:RHS repeat-associated core domain-containing protein [Flavivirga eckloniae]AUP79686.1 hypothetical protein C1H87_13605 [Flavivirga eckloniae]